MNKTIALASTFFFASVVFHSLASASVPKLECRAQLARASEAALEVVPSRGRFSEVELSKTGAGSTSMTFSLKGSTDLVYKLTLTAQTKKSVWNDQAKAFELEVQLWNLKSAQLIASKSLDSDNVRNSFLLEKIQNEKTAVAVFRVPNFEMRKALINSKDSDVNQLANSGRWIAATDLALTKKLIHPLTADFASLHCTMQN